MVFANMSYTTFAAARASLSARMFVLFMVVYISGLIVRSGVSMSMCFGDI